jgi:hypothetical protein
LIIGFGLDGKATSSVQLYKQNSAWGKHHGSRLDGAQACATGHEARQGFFLCNLERERIPFYSLVAAKLVNRKSATGQRLEHPSMVVGAYSSGGSFKNSSDDGDNGRGSSPK